MIYLYAPVWTEPKTLDSAVPPRPVSLAGPRAHASASRGRPVWRSRPGWSHGEPRVQLDPARRARRAAFLPLLVMADLLGAHWVDVPTVDPRYWTEPPASAQRLKASPDFIRVFGIGDKHSGEPGYASERVDFPGGPRPAGLEPALAWHLNAAKGNTPMISRRFADFTNEAAGEKLGKTRFDLEGDTHIVTGRRRRGRLPGAAQRACRHGVHPPQSRRAAARPADGPAGLRRRSASGRRRPRTARCLASATSSSSKIPPPAGGRRRGHRHGPDRRGPPGARRDRDRGDDARLSRPVRHVRPRLVGHRRRPVRHRSGPPTSPSGPSIFRRERTRSSSPTARRASTWA